MAAQADISPPQADVDELIASLDAGKPEEVVARGEALLGRFPDSFVVHDLLGVAHSRLEHFEEAARCFHKALAIRPDDAPGHKGLGIVLQNLGRLDEAAGCYRRALSIRPDLVDAHFNLGMALASLGRMDEAAACYREVVSITPDDADAHFRLACILGPLGRLEEAADSYRLAVGIAPDHAQAHHGLGVALHLLSRMDEAVASYARACELNPADAETHYNLGIALLALGRMDEAASSLERAVRLKPEHVEAHYHLGLAQQNLGRLDQAIGSHERALALDPDHAEAHAQRLLLLAQICDWDDIEREAGRIAGLGVSGAPVSPFCMLSFDDDPQRNRIRSERYAEKEYRPSPLAPLPRPVSDLPRRRRLRIGYFSSDFRDHATMHLMARLFELHDLDAFSIHIFSYGPDIDDAMTARVKAAVDGFHEVRLYGDRAVAELARSERIDIAVDLKGHTAASRLGIFACGAAPIQISYLGYPGTLGAPFIDYIIADQVVIPDEQRQHYSEKIIFLPHSYQVNDDSRPISYRAMTRDQMGLPESGFVFCCFNNSYKISPAEFDIWMRLLRQVEGSVLWLLKANPWVKGGLRDAAEKRGIDPNRLIFADHMPVPEHLARHALADLFLDTFNCNAHTTASDALWAGLPLVTRQGHGFAARVAASLLTAVGLPELITATSADYERLALELATDSARLAAIRERLAANRLSEPLFDTSLFTRHIEAAFRQTHDRYVQGSASADIMVG